MAYAPEDAEVSFVFPSKHAVGLRSDDGTEYLLHIWRGYSKSERRRI